MVFRSVFHRKTDNVNNVYTILYHTPPRQVKANPPGDVRTMPARDFQIGIRDRHRHRMGLFSSISIPITMAMAITMGSGQFATYCELPPALLLSGLLFGFSDASIRRSIMVESKDQQTDGG